MLDLYHNLNPVQLTEFGAQTTSANSAEVDMAGYDRLLIILRNGTWTTGDHAWGLEHSDTTSTGFVAVPADFLVPVDGAGFTDVLDATANDSYQKVEYRGGKQFVRVASVLGNTPNAEWGIEGVQASKRHAPV